MAATRDLGFPVDYTGIDPDVAAEIDGQLRKLVGEHPVLRVVIPAVRANPAMFPGMLMGYNRYRGIGLNRRELSRDADVVKQRLEADVAQGLHPPGCDSVSAGITHEVGEALAVHIMGGRAGGRALRQLCAWKATTPYDGLGRYVRIARDLGQGDERFPQALMAMLHTPPPSMGGELRQAVEGIREVLAEVDGW